MEKAIDTRTKLLTKNPFSLMLELSIPAILGMVVVGLYNMMDSIFIGQMVGAAQMGAVSVSYPFTLINAGSAAMLGVGSASVLSRAIGKKDEGTIKKIMGNLVAMVILLSVIYTIIGMVFTRQLLSLAGASDNILNYAEKYLRIVFAGSLFVNFFQSANMVIRGEGQLKKAMSIIASGAILNIILDPIFITILKPYGMGIEAAAFATILSQFVQAVITLWYFRKKSPNVKIGRIRIDGELLPQVLSVGVSALLMQILTLVQQTVIYRVAANYGGETSQILLGAALRFWNFSFVPLWGISQGFQPAAGTNYGAKDYDRVKTLTKVFVIAATVLSLIFYIPAELFPAKVLSMFITTPGVAASGATNFRIMFSTYVLQGSFMIAVTLFQSLGKANKATWLVLFRQIILFIPLCVLLPMIGGMGIRGVWLAIALTDEKGVLQVTTISGNALIDGLLADKFDVARKYEIAVEYHIEIPTKLPFDDADLCIIVGNALDNAIDGTKDIEGAKKIEISMGVKQGNFLLKVKNTFNPELIKFDNNGKRLRTSKTDKSNHGMGIGLIEETALKYNGLMEITMNENIFCLSVLLYQN